MRRSWVSVFLSLSILALLVGAALWMFHRGDREPASGERPGGAQAPIGGEDSTGRGLAGGAAEAEPAQVPAGSGPSEAASDPSIDGSRPPVSIEGRVTDATGNGVADARVAAVEKRALTEAIEKDAKLLDREALRALRAFRRSLGDVAKRLPSCLTAADGTYAFRGLPDGDHRVVVTHPEFLAHVEEGWILVETGRKVRYDVELVPGQAISGRVRDSKGGPVAGARVRATPVETARLKGLGKVVQVFIDQVEGASLLEASPVETDSLGAFRLTPLEPGAYDIRAVKEGYAWGEARDVPSGTEDALVALEPAIRIFGRVVSPAGDPVVSAAIVLREPERDIQGPDGPLAVAFVDVDLFGEKERGAASDEEGRFALEAFSGGTYDLIVRAEGFPEQRRQVALEGAPLDLGDIVLAQSREIAGTVLSPDGGPVEGAAVWVPKPPVRREDRDSRRISVLEAGPSSSMASAQTDRRGAFRLTGLGGDSHEVAVLAEGYPGDLLESVAAGSRGVTIVLQRGLAIRGRVVLAESGDPVPGARVGVEGGPAHVETTDEDGRFELRGVSFGGGGTFGGSIAVRASLDGYREARGTVAIPDPAAAPVAETELELHRLGKEDAEAGISGLVRDVRGEPIAGALVWTEVPGVPRAFLRAMQRDRAKEVRTDADGTFAVPAPRFGGQRFEVLASLPGLATSRAGPFEPDGDGGKWPFVEIVLGEGVSLEGRVTALDGEPISGARVRIWRDAQMPEEATLFTRILPQSVGEAAYSGKDGTYRLRRIESGSYRVQARAKGYAEKTIGPVEIRAALAAPGAEGPAAAGAPALIDIVLDAGGSLGGRVVGLEGDPLPGIEVVAFPTPARSGPAAGEEEDEIVRTGALGVAAAMTRADGFYEIDHLPEGDFRVLARARGFEPASIPHAVPGDSLPDLVLARHARIVGRVREAETGAPLRSFGVKLDTKDAEGQFQEDRSRSRDVDDAQGRFACDGLRAGEWRLRVVAKAHLAWQETVSLEPGGEVEVDAALSSGCRIKGVVRLPDGTPIAGVTIGVRIPGEWWDREQTRSGEDGGFGLAGLDGGSYQVQATHPDYFAAASEGAVKVEVSAAEDASVGFVLRPAGKIQGRIRGVVFKPPGADMWIVTFSPIAADSSEDGARKRVSAESPAAAPQPFWVWADESGGFSRESICPGKYRLELIHKRKEPDTGDEWIEVPPGSRPLGEVEIRAGVMASFNGEAP